MGNATFRKDTEHRFIDFYPERIRKMKIGIVFVYFATFAAIVNCYEDEWDIFTFTQEWPVAVCEKGIEEHHKCVIPSKVLGWGIHGLWPTKRGTRGPTSCGGGSAFDPKRLEPLQDQLGVK